jgi:hypothetical protein
MSTSTDYGPYGPRTERAKLAETHAVLIDSLRVAVPMWIWQLQGSTPEQRVVIARRCADHVAERGDVLMYGNRRNGRRTSEARGDCAKAFNALAEGLATGAYQPGGVTFAGQHWCTDHAACLAAERGEEPDPVLGDCGDGYAAHTVAARTVETVTVAGELL